MCDYFSLYLLLNNCWHPDDWFSHRLINHKNLRLLLDLLLFSKRSINSLAPFSKHFIVSAAPFLEGFLQLILFLIKCLQVLIDLSDSLMRPSFLLDLLRECADCLRQISLMVILGVGARAEHKDSVVPLLHLPQWFE